jgi:hypothetical protein
VFQVRVDALVDQQKASLIRHDDPLLMARFVWAVVHGVVMLVIDGQLQPEDGKRKPSIDTESSDCARLAQRPAPEPAEITRLAPPAFPKQLS